MKILREVNLAVIAGAAVNLTFPVAPSRFGFVDIMAKALLASNTFTIRAISDLDVYDLIQCSPFQGAGDRGWYFGGPASGHTLQLVTTAVDTIVFQARLWDGPGAPFGKVPLAAIEQAGIAPAASSVTATAQVRSAWVNLYDMTCIGDQARTLDCTFGLSFDTPTFEVVGTGAAGVAIASTRFALANFTTAAIRVTNTGGAALATSARVMGYLG